MKILIVLVVTILGAVVGGFVGGSMVDESAVNVPTRPADGPRDQAREMLEAQRAFSAGAEVAAQRQRNVMIGGGVGAALGLAAGVLAASRLGRRAMR